MKDELMTDERYAFLMSEEGWNAKLTQEEIDRGWHFCFEFDGLLRNNSEEEPSGFKCTCLDASQP